MGRDRGNLSLHCLRLNDDTKMDSFVLFSISSHLLSNFFKNGARELNLAKQPLLSSNRSFMILSLCVNY